MPALFDLDARFRAMDTAGDGYVQILTTANPPVESIARPADALELSRIANDEMAELVSRYPDRFIGAAACLPMNDVDAAIGELDRAVEQLGSARRPDLHRRAGTSRSTIRDSFPCSTTSPQLDIPILLHPVRGPDRPTTRPKTASRFDTWRDFGWLYDTVSAMTRLDFSGLFDRHPDIKIVTHHLGGFAPYAVGADPRGLRQAAQGRTRQERTGSADEASASTISTSSTPTRSRSDRCPRCVRPRLLRRRSRACSRPTCRSTRRADCKYVEVALEAMEQLDVPASRQGRKSSSTTPPRLSA